MSVKRAIREGWSQAKLRRELAIRHVNAAMAHARWAGRRLAKTQMFCFEQNASLARMNMLDVTTMHGILHQYRVEPELYGYALEVAREHAVERP